jgi:hypothetical protein
MTLGMGFLVVNNSTGSVEVRAANAATVATVIAGTATLFVSIDTTAGNGAAGWSSEIVGFSGVTGTGNAVLATSPTVNSATLNNATLTGTLTANSSAGTNGQYLQSTATGVQWASITGGTSITQGNSSVAVVDAGTGTITTTVDGTVVQTDSASGSAFSGIPTAPTAAVSTSTTQIATTEFAVREALAKAVAMSIALG